MIVRASTDVSLCIALSTFFPNEQRMHVWQAGSVAKKTLQFNIRMSEAQRADLEEMCRRRGRPLSYQIEHLIGLAKLVLEFTDGNDDLEFVKARLALAKKLLK